MVPFRLHGSSVDVHSALAYVSSTSIHGSTMDGHMQSPLAPLTEYLRMTYVHPWINHGWTQYPLAPLTEYPRMTKLLCPIRGSTMDGHSPPLLP